MEMIERVARAIATVNGDENWEDIPANKVDWTSHGGMFNGRFRDMNEPKQVDYLDMAEAAIQTMREPTIAMRKVCAFETAEIEYPAMIDAALAQPPSSDR